MDPTSDERLLTEIELLKSMYPGQLTFDSKARDLCYSNDNGKSQFRLSDAYLFDALPEVLTATAGRVDVRDQLKQQMREFPLGEEILDSAILAFDAIAEGVVTSNRGLGDSEHSAVSREILEQDLVKHRTVIVWLHHLLNTSKRKQALNPSSREVSGITKPGYPGVLIFSGPRQAVNAHVNELKQLNWQAFQVRLETDDAWIFTHGAGVVEVEAMKDVVAEIVEYPRREDFLATMKIK